MAKTHRDFKKEYIGNSDGAMLVLVGGKKEDKYGIATTPLFFGEDGRYEAYVIDQKAQAEKVPIPDYYNLVAEFDDFLRIYDDDEKTRSFVSEHVRVYRAKEMGCIIELS